jgi:LysR family transcriptional activator of nhaA
MGVFPASRLDNDDLALTRGLQLLGACGSVDEEIHAIISQRGQQHPLVQQVLLAKA